MDYCVICGQYCEEGTMVCINCIDKYKNIKEENK